MREATRDDDDATRQVIADALTERGDPRGELIALDLRLKADGSRGPLLERARELRSLHLAHLLGPLAPLVEDATWDRGYAEHVVLAVKHDPDLVAATGSPLWRTVRSIDVVRHHRRHDGHLTRLLAHDVLFGLRSLRGHLPDSLLVQLARGPARPLETLVCGRGSLGPHQDDAVTRELFDGPGLAGLRTLAFDEPLEDGATLAWIGETPVGAGLTSLDVSAPFEDLPAW
ncbi:MAG: hypothetical protein KC656_28525, partial [Myxococcales bacterium]|nr:hypothetical protein [Myxococcales bacterium]